MNINQLIFRNFKKNVKNYYLYVFALMFSAALYFAFVTLQYDPALDATKGSIKGGAAVRAASVLLVAIVSIFLLYANTIFIKRRSKEIGLFQLIGMTKTRIFRILTAENFMLYFSSLIVGILIGFSFSKVIIMILFKITDTKGIAKLHFSEEALIQTLIVFGAIYLLIMTMNYLFIKRQTILALFRVTSSTEGKTKKISILEIIIGILGIIFIASGYYISAKLFDGSFTSMNALAIAMISILALVIIGTYLFYKGSVRFLLNLMRKSKNGYLTINDVLSLSSIMFRMKSNALLLTVITTVSALAIGFLCLSYISYYSAEKSAGDYVPNDFAINNSKDAASFKAALDRKKIAYTEKKIDVIQVKANVKNILENDLESPMVDSSAMTIPMISEKSVSGVDVAPNETLFTGYNNMLQKTMAFKDSGRIELKGKQKVIPQKFVGLNRKFLLPIYFTGGGLPTAIVDNSIFNKFKQDADPSIQKESSLYTGIDISKEDDLPKANELFGEMKFSDNSLNNSRIEMAASQKQNMGLIMFIVAFLGLAFLITSGCILYFKQMDESEDEKPNYTILRKLGFTEQDLLKGIKIKQLFNFGIPLIVGLLHSYFAVQSGWFLFGTEVWTPMIIVMIVYTALYSIFGILSVLYYKKIIKEAL
ncbi:ABC transporter permease [Priestia megaterium]|uniref:FtsX-like permease family protein n=1 Tax=Priestia megaterium (strain ATCC 14581 / DSM 32 / CCUG 1817 / JCM 2506 / NBRC 15308 / NCIMB 9376 / NCTC 10342 / NRRL B-14308 / VKM B-512 / Ford 19) TaxID=1348623 RepID=A0A0B6ANL0_PRIM2|nr:ABC transporter permease [Priestia megaterium]AJI25096.1 ftsX-like permease family protein [Priestia megaterium NBRC 15308 = ATCC 14581]KFN05187.1 ftsX-like permease family protein [Priestia megaterium]KGJ77309.1 bacitracin ABC transporter permease [Priestia megaterium NBRC 15308 = ATCC 14581]MDR4229876.1 ABC transporter permease [Priestia megaterium]MED3809600.1 ABC transporter permease [Priestia megaterium]